MDFGLAIRVLSAMSSKNRMARGRPHAPEWLFAPLSLQMGTRSLSHSALLQRNASTRHRPNCTLIRKPMNVPIVARCICQCTFTAGRRRSRALRPVPGWNFFLVTKTSPSGCSKTPKRGNLVSHPTTVSSGRVLLSIYLFTISRSHVTTILNFGGHDGPLQS